MAQTNDAGSAGIEEDEVVDVVIDTAASDGPPPTTVEMGSAPDTGGGAGSREGAAKASGRSSTASLDFDGNVVHDQLPDVEEYKAQAGPTRRPRSKISQRRMRKRLMLAVSFVIVVVVSVTIGVIVGRDTAGAGGSYAGSGTSNLNPWGEDESARSTGAPGGGGEGVMFKTRTDEIVAMVTSMAWSDPLLASEEDTPQYEAAVWLAENDPKRLEVKDTPEFRQRYALAVFYYALSGSGDLNRWYDGKIPWLTGDDVCQWSASLPNNNLPNSGGEDQMVEMGVRCYGGSKVKEIYLPYVGAEGTIPDELELLWDLQGLFLKGNDILGELPSKLRNLKNLRDLDLSDNHLQGTFPELLLDFPDLRYLNLNENSFQGGLPQKFVGLSNLEAFNIGYNNFTDNINKLSVLKNVRELDISNNSFVGTFESNLLNSWPNIETLDMSDNVLKGPLPSNLFEMKKLQIIDLHGNFFNETLPPRVIPDSSLDFLALHENELTGSIDVITQNLTQLSHLDLSSNWFSGTMGSFERMSNLRYLFLAFNSRFQRGPIPQSIVSLPGLVDLSLQMTERDEVIPSGFGSNQNLVFLDLSYNYITGQLPSDLGETSSLRFLLLNRNEGLTGTIPETFSGMTNLQTLLLDRTGLSGSLEQNPICKNRPPNLMDFIADCDEIGCPQNCCTECCEDGDANTVTTCNDEVWSGQLDPVADYKYKRTEYKLTHSSGPHPANENNGDPASPTGNIPAQEPPADNPAQDQPVDENPEDGYDPVAPPEEPPAQTPAQEPPAESPAQEPPAETPAQDQPGDKDPEDAYDNGV